MSCLWRLKGSGTDLGEYFSYLLPGSVYKCTKLFQLSATSISLLMHHRISVIFCQYQSKIQQSISVICCEYQSTNEAQYYSYQLPVSVYQCTTVFQICVASISLQMHHSTVVISCQYQSTNAPQKFSYLLQVSVFQCTTVFQLYVASISLTKHQSTSVICCQ